MQVSESLIPCSFCHKSFPQGEVHDCVTKIYSILNSAAKVKKPETIFDNVDNMVFQGGGMLGLAYLGMMQRLEQLKPGIFANLKRVAGNSAGSILTLYLGLNLSYPDIAELMNRKYFDLLDTDIAIHVTTNPEDDSYNYKDFYIKDVLFKSASLISGLIKEIEEERPAAQDKLRNLFILVAKYLNTKLKIKLPSFLKLFKGTILWFLGNEAAKWLISWFVTPKQQKYLRVQSFQHITTPDNQDKKDAELMQTVSRIIDEAFETVNPEVDPNQPQEKPQKLETPEQERLWKDLIANSVKEYSEQFKHPITNVSPGSELAGDLLVFAFSELIWYTIITRTDSTGQKIELAYFTGRKIKEELIEGAIKLKFDKLGRSGEYKEGFTFKDLDKFTDAQGKKLFRPFFVTAYNTSNYLTEVFSLYHTPNAVAADAVRSSMSIPIFFKPEVIRENGQPKRVYYDDGNKSEIVHYMDGGVLDNYPLWMFDDFKYAFDDIETFEPTRKHVIQNPKTLGVRLLSPETVDYLEKPFFDTEQTKKKRVATSDFKDTFGYVGPSVAQSLLSQTLDNDVVKRGNCPRSIHINYHDVSALDFDMSLKDQKVLIDAGARAVDDYRRRAETNFRGEGDKYV